VQAKAAAPQSSKAPPQAQDEDDGESGSEESDGEEGGGHQNYDNIDGAYNPRDYSHLNVSTEIRDLFQYIERYKVQPVELETSLKCFIPDYIPAIGEMDAFIKVAIIYIMLSYLTPFRFQDPMDGTMSWG
jgi:intraflagellar transport protein 46